MKAPRFDRRVLKAILTGAYSPQELHEFVQLCCSLAAPLIRRKIALGKINLGIIGLNERGIVEDCVADLFAREDSAHFVQIVHYFKNQEFDINEASDERLLIALRRLVLGKVNNSIVRLYGDTDPTLGKILRNITIFLERNRLFVKHIRLGEAYLMTASEPLCDRPPIPMECIHRQFNEVASPRDTVPAMLRKVQRILVWQEEYQRTVPLVGIALMFKEVYVQGGEVARDESFDISPNDAVESVIESVCRRMEKSMYETYVASGKKSFPVFHCYMSAVREILIALFVDDDKGLTYFVALSRHIPQLTKRRYARQHRMAFEHIAKKAKEQTRRRLKHLLSATVPM